MNHALINENSELTQPANIGLQDVPKTSPSNVVRTSPKYPIWASGERPNLTSWERPEMTSRGRSNLMFKGLTGRLIRDILSTFSGCHLQSTHTWMPQHFFNFSFRTYSIDQIYLKALQYSGFIENPMKLAWRILVSDFLAINGFCERTSSQKLDWILNMPLILPSNIIWNAYRLIAEAKISRFSVSLICLLYVKEKWTGKKV